MLIFIMLSCLSSSKLLIYSPSPLSMTQINYTVSYLGIVPFFQLIGQIEFRSGQDCKMFGNASGKFILTSLYDGCSYEKLALFAAKSDAKLIIFALDELSIIRPSDYSSSRSVSIPVIGISKSDSDILQKYNNSIIWATFVYKMRLSNNLDLRLALSGNYSNDYEFIRQLASLHKDNLDNYNIQLKISYLNPDSELVQYWNDCLIERFGTYCMKSSNDASGYLRIQHYIQILNYFLKNPSINSL